MCQSIEGLGLPIRSVATRRINGCWFMSAMRYLRDWWYLARANTGHALQMWYAFEDAPMQLASPGCLEVVVQEAKAVEPTVVKEAETSDPTAGLPPSGRDRETG